MELNRNTLAKINALKTYRDTLANIANGAVARWYPTLPDAFNQVNGTADFGGSFTIGLDTIEAIRKTMADAYQAEIEKVNAQLLELGYKD